jgi:hypothetical protein
MPKNIQPYISPAALISAAAVGRYSPWTNAAPRQQKRISEANDDVPRVVVVDFVFEK